MNCKYWNLQIALEVEGDLSPRQGHRLAKHLGVCPACRRFAQELSRSQAVLKSLAHEAVDGRVFEVIQERVIAELASGKAGVICKRMPWIAWNWRWTATSTIALLLVVGGAGTVWKRSSRQISSGLSESRQKMEALVGGRLGTTIPEPIVSNRHSSSHKSSLASIQSRRSCRYNVAHRPSLTPSSRPPLDEPNSQGEQLEANPSPGRTEESRSREHGVPTGNQADQPNETSETEPLVIKLVTNDPEIVIVWLVGPDRGERQ